MIELAIPDKYGDTKDCFTMVKNWLERLEKDNNMCFLTQIHCKDFVSFTDSEVIQRYNELQKLKLNPK